METTDKIIKRLDGLPKRFHTNVIKNYEWELNEFFSPADPNEEKDYRQWAHEHFNPDMEIKFEWHPTVVDECCKIIKEFNQE
jgi:hypothetical protein